MIPKGVIRPTFIMLNFPSMAYYTRTTVDLSSLGINCRENDSKLSAYYKLTFTTENMITLTHKYLSVGGVVKNEIKASPLIISQDGLVSYCRFFIIPLCFNKTLKRIYILLFIHIKLLKKDPFFKSQKSSVPELNIKHFCATTIVGATFCEWP